MGVGLGVGNTTIEQCSNCRGTGGNLAMDFQVGGFIHPRLAIMLDISGFSKTERDTFLDEYGYPYTAEYRSSAFLAAVAAQVWVMPGLWIRGGVGPSNFRLHSDCLLYTSPSPRDATLSRMPSSA